MIRLTNLSLRESDMQLRKVSYNEWAESRLHWAFDNLEFGDINLIVSRNAVGKSRIVASLNSMAHGLLLPIKVPYASGHWTLAFQDNSQPITYEVDINNRQVIKEIYNYHGLTKLDRNSSTGGKIFNSQVHQDINFNIQPDEVVISRRDSLQYPFFTPLHEWADAFHFYSFSSDLGKSSITAMPTGGVIPFDQHNKNQAVMAFTQGCQRWPNEYVKALIDDMQRIGYVIEDIQPRRPAQFTLISTMGDVFVLSIKEAGIGDFIDQGVMSNGMFRCLSVLIQINYSSMAGNQQCLVIDDIGEGLDYERSCELVKLLMEKAKKTGLQLIMTTNDRFIMNAVPLEYWTILERQNEGAKFFNYKNSKDIFDHFKYTGLSNFDFFSTDYMHREKPDVA